MLRMFGSNYQKQINFISKHQPVNYCCDFKTELQFKVLGNYWTEQILNKIISKSHAIIN